MCFEYFRALSATRIGRQCRESNHLLLGTDPQSTNWDKKIQHTAQANWMVYFLPSNSAIFYCSFCKLVLLQIILHVFLKVKVHFWSVLNHLTDVQLHYNYKLIMWFLQDLNWNMSKHCRILFNLPFMLHSWGCSKSKNKFYAVMILLHYK